MEVEGNIMGDYAFKFVKQMYNLLIALPPTQQFYFYTRQRPHIIGTSQLFILRRLLHI